MSSERNLSVADIPAPSRPPLSKLLAGAFRYPGVETGLKALAILLGTFLVYIQAIRFGFNWDDNAFLTQNPLIHASDGLFRFWFTTEAPDYFPLTSSMLWVEWRLWGPNPAGFHAVNILLHAISATLIWLVLRALKMPGAWLAGIIFAVHPVNVESVAWITERKNTLPMVFLCLSTLLYVRHLERGRVAAYAGAWVAFLFALLSKTSVVMLPLVFLGLAAWQRGRVTRKDLLSILPFLGLSLILGLVTLWFQYHRAIGPDVVRTDGFFSRLAVAGCAIWFYLYKALLPINLCFVYPRWEIDASSPVSYLPVASLVALGFLLWRYRSTWGKPFLLGLGYFAITLFPVLGFFDIYFMRYSLVADHWQYVSIVGVIALVCAGAGTATQKLGGLKRRWAHAGAGAVVLVLGALSVHQMPVYKDESALWAHTLNRNPQAWIAHHNLGNILRLAGQTDKSLKHLKTAVGLRPGNPDIRCHLAAAYLQGGSPVKAEEQARKALELEPDNLWALDALGMALADQGKTSAANDVFEQALVLVPDALVIHDHYGAHLMRSGDDQGAKKHLEAALRIAPDLAPVHANYGRLLEKMGKIDEAIASLRHSLALGPQSATTYESLGHLLARKGQHLSASEHFSKALELDPTLAGASRGLLTSGVEFMSAGLSTNPEDAEMRHRVALSLMSLGRYPEAASHLTELLKRDAKSIPALDALAWIYSTDLDPETRNVERAIELAEKACHLTNRQEAGLLDTLAIAYSNADRFEDAQKTVKEAMDLLDGPRDADALKELGLRLKLYQAKRRFLRR